jgi:hypothetical protein
VLRIIKGTASRDFRLLFDDQTASVDTKDAEKKFNFFFSNTRGVIRIMVDSLGSPSLPILIL